MEKKKGSRWYSFLIYGVIIALIAFLIYFIVNQSNQKYKQVATQDAISYVQGDVDDADQSYDIVQAVAESNQSQVTLYYTAATKGANGDVVFTGFFATFNDVDFYNTKWISVGEEEPVTIPVALYKQILVNKEKEIYKPYLEQMYFNSKQYQENPFLSWLPTILSTVLIAFNSFNCCYGYFILQNAYEERWRKPSCYGL